ncbi:uncharacterized protein KGF55_005650 [Candida pseudojiufengensis]|uniref:uncharacterized protein n=1 Tax=Candida pseudojiufengensis TaxID=497109 RepID=UPI002224A2B0|nr:uncharacterized protein KGF55_005650 [Candida pseudojiufengensis]KAI5958996.1 hypothetical protein KGF55_005650 [Candida pseudojiufengensis]
MSEKLVSSSTNSDNFLNDDEKNPVITTILSADNEVIQLTEKDADQALKYALAHKDDGYQIDEASNRRILRKIDTFLLPIMCLLYCFQFMDKLTTSYSAILGLRTELHMKGDMYSWTSSCFYLGYLVFEFPASVLLQRFPVAKTVSTFIILWGMILALNAVPQYAGLIALRTILGMLESAVTPAFAIITSQWYKKEEQFLRTSWWFASNGIGTILGSAISYGLYTHQHSYSLPAWKLVFIVTGVLTIFLGFIILFHVPDTPTQAWFLNEEEKVLVVERIRSNQQGFGNKRFKKKQFIEALTDHRTWLFFFFALIGNIPNGGLLGFGTILLNGQFKFSTSKSLLMGMPSGAVEIVGCVLLAWTTRFFKSRMLIAIFATVLSVIAQCLLAFAPTNQGKLAGYYLNSIGPVGFICIISQISSSVAGHTKKITVNSLLLIGYCVGNLIGPQTFVAKEAPDYRSAKITIVVCGFLDLFILIAICISYFLDNKRRDARSGKEEKTDELFENFEFADLTDKENPRFRYAL